MAVRAMKKYFITYGDERFARSRDRLCRQASKFGFFDVVRGFTGKSLSSLSEWRKAQKLDEFKRVIGRSTHAWWAWKPAIIYYMLSEIMSDNDVLFYSDGGSTLPTWNQGSKPKEVAGGYRGMPQYKHGKEFAPHSLEHSLLKFSQYTEMINSAPNSCIAFPLHSIVNDKPILEKYWTKPDVFDHFKVKNNKSIRDTLQRAGGMLHAARKSPFTLRLYKEWWLTAKHHPSLFSDETSYPDFFKKGLFHRHDQSVWSILSKIHGSIEADPEEEFMCPILTTRYNTADKIHNTPY